MLKLRKLLLKLAMFFLEFFKLRIPVHKGDNRLFLFHFHTAASFVQLKILSGTQFNLRYFLCQRSFPTYFQRVTAYSLRLVSASEGRR